MPLHRFCCTLGHTIEELFRISDDVPDALVCPRCGDRAVRTVGVVYTNGPVWDGLEFYNQALLSPAQRRAGQEFKTASQIARWEREQGLQRTSDPERKFWAEKGRDETSTRKRIVSEDGQQAEAKWVYKQEMQDSTGWSDSQYIDWKDKNDAAQELADSGNAPGLDYDGAGQRAMKIERGTIPEGAEDHAHS
jgi:hypothetical protein